MVIYLRIRHDQDSISLDPGSQCFAEINWMYNRKPHSRRMDCVAPNAPYMLLCV